VGSKRGGGNPVLSSPPTPFARLLLPRLDTLRSRLVLERSLTQVKTTELLTTFLEVAPESMHAAICDAGLLEAGVEMFLAPDRNGGGQQDAVRHHFLRGVRAVLGAGGSPCLHRSLVSPPELPGNMLRALTSNARTAPPREFVKLLYTELRPAAERHASKYRAVPNWSRGWADLTVAMGGGSAPWAPTSAPSSPLVSSPTSLPSPHGAARPAELIHIEEDEAISTAEGLPAMELPPAIEGDASADAALAGMDEEGSWSSPPLEGEGGGASGPSAAGASGADIENVDPNSPPSWAKRSRPRQLGACGTPTPRGSTGTMPSMPPPSSPPMRASSSSSEQLSPGDAGGVLPAGTQPGPGTPRPMQQGTQPGPGTPRPMQQGTQPGPGTPRPEGVDAGGTRLGFVVDSTLRTSEDFSRDTPQPKLVRRAYLHRKAKEPSANIFSPGSSPKRERTPTNAALHFDGAAAAEGAAAEGAAAEDGAHEDASMSSLRSSVRSLMF
jgi:hypothetical protein